MADSSARRLAARYRRDDLRALGGLRTITNYQPNNSVSSITALNAECERMQAAQKAETQAQAALTRARNEAIAAEWQFHRSMQRAKKQVQAQFGTDAVELEIVGWTPESKRKKRRQKPR